VEELIEIDDFKYALVGVTDLETAEELCRYFKEIRKEKHIDGLKATIHPLSCKVWNEKQKN
jgi:hypothetical protein